MRAFALILLMIKIACGASCSSPKEHTLPPPGPPIPAPPPAAAPAPPQRVLMPHPSLSRKRVVVAVLRADGNRRELDGENTVRVANTLAQNGIASRKATALPSDLPPKLLDAALASAEAFLKGGGAAEVFLYGEIAPGKEVQVRLAAVDLGARKVIDNFGNQGPPALLGDIIHRTLEETVNSVDSYFRR